MQAISNTVINALETVKDSIENRDEEVKQRAKVFASEEKAALVAQEEPQLEHLKAISYELLDIGLFYGEKGVNSVKSLPLY